MKKTLFSGAFIVAFAIYTIHQMFEGSESSALGSVLVADNSIPSESTSSQTATTPPTVTTVTTPTPPAPTPQPQQQSLYKDGTYTGKVTDAYYGNIQVRATISNGKLANVVFLQYPNDRSTSIMINNQAMPYLKQEAIAAQSANVDIVSGATDSSQAFKQSLSSALTQAKV
jgi:uncharacterized protein with FMN-binding domain